MTNPALSANHLGTITSLFSSSSGAECAYRAAVELGYDQSEINLVMTDETRQRFLSGQHPENGLSAKAAESTTGSSKVANELGGHLGGALGTIAPALAAIGTLVLIPGIALAGPIAVALTAAGAVGVAGGLIGALSNWGIPDDRIHQYEASIRRGGILLGVKPRSDDGATELKQRWKACGGELIHS
jgi:hypothetical protein